MMKSDHKVKNIFFDLDGTLANSDQLFWEANFQILKKLKININKEDILKKYFTESFGITKILQMNGYSREEIQLIKEERNEIYIASLKKNVEFLENVEGVLDYLKSKKYKLWIVSTSTKKIISPIYEKLKMSRYFDKENVISGDLVPNGKPDPAIYRLALEKSKSLMEECLAVEDSPKGVSSACNAGLQCIFIPNKNLLPDFDKVRLTNKNLSFKVFRDLNKIILLV